MSATTFNQTSALRERPGTPDPTGGGPLPAGVPTTLTPGLTYLRYNVSDAKARLALVSGARAALGTTGKRWALLRMALRADVALPRALGRLGPALRHVRAAGDAAVAEAVAWPVLAPWLWQPGHLDALTGFVEQATEAEWATWLQPRRNVTRYRILREVYARAVGIP